MTGSHTKAHTAKGWKKVAPHRIVERRALLGRCGKQAFLLPSTLKYPVMPKTGPCKIHCGGLRAALSRAARFSPKAHRRAQALAKQIGCAWAVS